MKDQLQIDIVNILVPYLSREQLSEVQMKITIALDEYEVSKRDTEIVEYKGDKNQRIIVQFLAAKIAQGLSKRTVKYYKESVSKTLQTIGKPYDEITANDVRLYIAKRIQRDGVKKVTVDNERRNLSAFYYWLQKEEIILKNPMKKIDPIKITKEKKKAYSSMEIEEIRAACKTTRETALIEVMLSTWCRVSEIAAMEITNIKDNSITVLGKGDKVRTVYLNAKAQLAIERYMAQRSDTNPYLFPMAKYAGDITKLKSIKKVEQAEWYKNPELVDNSDHIGAGTIESIVRKIGKRAGVTDTHPHRFRRTGATFALRQGMPLITVSKMLGHESIGTTQIYLDISDEELEENHKKYVT